MRHNLDSLEGVIEGSILGVIDWATRSLDNGSYGFRDKV